MKKFLALLIVFISLPFCGWAETYSSGSEICADSAIDNNSVEVAYLIYFDTARDSTENIGVKTACTGEYTKIKNKLNARSKDIAGVVVIGSADQTGDGQGFDNTTLAKSRKDWVIKNILPSGVEAGDWVAGSQDAKAKEAVGSQPEWRSVAIYIIWRTPSCESLRTAQEDLTAAFAKCSGVTISPELKKCFDGQNLTVSEDERLFAFFSEALQKCAPVKEISNHFGISVDVAYNKISAFIASLDRTVWRDEDGNFNTARLASDSIAAVVLGTAGGIITSKLVKKSQIKKGFEDLNCSIGGQRVASYGDEFTVGLQ